MAELHVDGRELRLVLSVAEKAEGLHGDLSAPVSALRDVEVLDDAHGAAGWRAGIKVGTRIPGVVEVGRVLSPSAQRFVAVHHDTPRGVRIRLEGQSFDEWIVGCRDPEGVAALLKGEIR